MIQQFHFGVVIQRKQKLIQIYIYIYTWLFIVALYTVAEIWKKLMCP